MVIVPSGDYRRGRVSGTRCFRNELPLLSVTIDEPFALSKHEITFDNFDRFTETTGNRRVESRHPQRRGVDEFAAQHARGQPRHAQSGAATAEHRFSPTGQPQVKPVQTQ